MAIDTSIYGQLRPIQLENPLEQYARVAQIKGAQTQNRLADLVFGEKQREVQQENALSQLYRDAIGADGKLDRAKVLTGAAQNNLGAKIPVLQKGFAEQDKATADLEKTRWDAQSKKLEIAGQAFGYVRNNPTLEAAHSVLDYLGSNGVYDAATVQNFKQIVASDPTKIKALADQAFQAVLEAKEQKSTFQTRNTGGTTDTIEINPVTGKAQVVNSVKNTQSPDSVASVAATMRGQNMADARAREANGKGQYDAERGVLVDPRTGVARPVIGPSGAPIGEKDKPLTEGQSKAALFGARMQAANQILDGLAANGTTTAIPGMRAPVVGGMITSMSSSNQQSLDQAQRDFINATLRRESGAAIADSEFENANKQYFPQPNDSDKVIAQKKAARERAARGILAEVPSNKRDALVAEINGPSAASGVPDDIAALLQKHRGKR